MPPTALRTGVLPTVVVRLRGSGGVRLEDGESAGTEPAAAAGAAGCEPTTAAGAAACEPTAAAATAAELHDTSAAFATAAVVIADAAVSLQLPPADAAGRFKGITLQ